MVSMRMMMMMMMPWWLSLSSAVLLRDETEDHLLLLFLLLLLLLLLPATRSLDDGRPHPYLKRLSPLRVNYSCVVCLWRPNELEITSRFRRKRETPHPLPPPPPVVWRKVTTRDFFATKRASSLEHNARRWYYYVVLVPTHTKAKEDFFQFQFLVLSPRGLRYQCLGFGGEKRKSPNPTTKSHAHYIVESIA